MGIYDREYYRGGRVDAKSFLAQTVVGRLILVNVAVFVLQVVFGPMTRLLACSASDIFGGFPQVWKLVTACFAHGSPLHIAVNMLLLFFFGRELERIYGKRDFLILYLTAGALAVFCEAGITQLTYDPGEANDLTPFRAPGLAALPAVDRPILGASGSIMALVLLFATFFPNRTVLLFFVIPMPMWVLCLLVILGDVMGLQSGDTGTAHWAHLAGAAFGFCYRRFDLRWKNVARRFGGAATGRRPRSRASGALRREELHAREVSQRIDELLAKIHERGMSSLTEEEQQFLLENSKRYRSP